MQPGHAHFSFEPLSVSASPSDSASPLEPLSPLSDLSPSPPLPSNVQSARTRLASGTADRLSQRRQDVAEHALPPSNAATPTRRMRPLACMTSSTNVNMAAQAQTLGNKEKSWKAGSWVAAGGHHHQQQAKVHQVIEFPPKHVVLHADDANNKVFLALGRALMSVNNCAMTIKDLAELSMQHGLICQNVSAASQAITFFIRSHLNRCEEEKDFPLLLRHVLSGTPRDDALAPALYSRTGGNVSNKDKTARDENGNLKERITCFRRGTTVWYLSKAAGAPCPFARAGIALRDYAECSSITNVESRKGDSDFARGLKRKREHNLRRRAESGSAACPDDSDSSDERKPTRIKLTLRLRPCPPSTRRKGETDVEDSSSSSSSDSDSDTQDDPMELDSSARSTASPPVETTSTQRREPTWIFPPYPIQRRISIPPYTPSEEIYPSIYTSPTANFSSPTFFSEWPTSTKPLVCVDPPLPKAPRSNSYFNRQRAASVSSIASPPPESEDEFGFDEDDDDEVSFSMSPEIKFKREDQLTYVWPQAAPSTSSLDLAHVKLEVDDDLNGVGSSKRSSTQTVKQEKYDDLDVDIASLRLSFAEGSVGEVDTLGSTIKHEDEEFAGLNDGFSWGQPVDLTRDDPVESICESTVRTDSIDDTALWKNVELLGPETVCLQDLEDGGWEEGHMSQGSTYSPLKSQPRPSLEHGDERAKRDVRVNTDRTSSNSTFGPPASPTFSLDSLSPPPSLTGSVHTWSIFSPDTETDSVGPASPASLAGTVSPGIVRSDESSLMPLQTNYDAKRSSPLMIPRKPVVPSRPSRQAVAVRSDDIPGIPLSEHSAPWERGMYTEEDVEHHLLEPPQPLAMMSIRLPSQTDASLENDHPIQVPPLSPQEEAVFQSLCICPDMSLGDDAQANIAKEETKKAPEVQAPRVPDVALTKVFAQATRPTMRLRERRPSKRLTELEQIRKQAQVYHPGIMKEAADKKEGSDAEVDSGMTLRSRRKDTQANRVENTNLSKGPLRRSKRVANAAAMQRNRERLRKRTVS